MRDSELDGNLSSSVPLETPCDSYQDVYDSIFTCYMRLLLSIHLAPFLAAQSCWDSVTETLSGSYTESITSPLRRAQCIVRDEVQLVTLVLHAWAAVRAIARGMDDYPLLAKQVVSQEPVSWERIIE